MAANDSSAAAAATAASVPVPPELHSGQDMLAWKREYNIRQREADWKRRQEELLTQKQVAWQIEACERENRIASAREARRREDLETRVYRRHLEIDRRYKERCRDVETERRERAWEAAENARLVEMQSGAREADRAGRERLRDAKLEAFDEMRRAAAERAEKQRRGEELRRKREENIRLREEAQRLRGAENARGLKSDDVARSKAVVDSFVERTVPVESALVSILTARPVDPQFSHFGASAGAIL
mmetsp:Transcript_98641/g.279558  ORF Transcript_98641/g.279558 Transcript_98641/m.279558 type:complete len:245 (+) Transcript_98641:52-786(+)